MSADNYLILGGRGRMSFLAFNYANELFLPFLPTALDCQQDLF